MSSLFIVSDIMTTALYPLVHDVMQRNIMCVWFWVLTVLKNCASIWSSELKKRLFCATLNNAVWSALYVNCTFSLIRFFNVEFWVSIIFVNNVSYTSKSVKKISYLKKNIAKKKNVVCVHVLFCELLWRLPLRIV